METPALDDWKVDPSLRATLTKMLKVGLEDVEQAKRLEYSKWGGPEILELARDERLLDGTTLTGKGKELLDDMTRSWLRRYWREIVAVSAPVAAGVSILHLVVAICVALW